MKKDVSHKEQDVEGFLVDENYHVFFFEIASSFGCVAAAAISHDGGPCDAWDDSVAITDIENLAP